MRKIKFLALVLAASVFVVSCQKGDAGPAGAAGATGPAGPAGPAGPTGTANVIYSDWIDVTFSQASFSDTINAAQLTSDILAKGEVKVYVNIGSADNVNVIPLPVSDFFYGQDDNNNNLILSVQPIFSVGMIVLQLGYGGTFLPNTIPANGKKYFQYRYILIPGGVKTTSKIDWNNYSQVKTYLNLQN